MASDAVTSERFPDNVERDVAGTRGRPRPMPIALLAPLGSLKITVVLFAISIFLILVSTLAQIDKNMWEVIRDYYGSWITWVDLQVFFPRSWFPRLQNIPGGFWFPGGAAIGSALAINLFTAHISSFKVQTRGGRLVAGLLVTALGAGITVAVIMSGHSRQGMQGQSPVALPQLWMLVKFALGGVTLCLAGAYAASTLRADAPSRRAEQLLIGFLCGLFGLLTVYVFVAGETAYVGDAGMRILWQLIQGEIAAVVLLVGCWLVFKKRGGIVLIHAGIALIMLNQYIVFKYHVEEQMTVEEGQTISFARDTRQTELAMVDSHDESGDDVVVIPKSFLLASERGRAGSWWGGSAPLDDQGAIQHEDLPCDVRVLAYYQNARLREAKADEENLATAGTGLQYVAVPVKPSSGTDSSSGIDLAAAYVKLTEKDGSGELGTYLVSQIASSQEVAEQVTLDGKSYDLSLRFRRNYKPYSVTLLDVRKDDYLGTNTPRNYSSDIRLVDHEREAEYEQHIWMNNPLRYAGETFYQSGYAGPPDVPVERTTLQLVTNSGWMIPYVACMIVGTGVFAHFCMVLLRFLRRRSENVRLRWVFLPTVKDWKSLSAQEKTANACLAAFFLLLVGWLIGSFVPPRVPAEEMQIHAFGKLPLVADGRVKPFDTLARNSLRIISNRETFQDESENKQPAIRWLLDVIADPRQADKHPVFRIVNLEVLDTLGLKRRKGSRYSVEELRGGLDKFYRQVAQTRQRDAAELSTYERKLLELDQQLHAYIRVTTAFQPFDPPDLPSPDDDQATRDQKIRAFTGTYERFVRNLNSARPALAVPLPSRDEDGEDKEWQSYARAWSDAYLSARLGGGQPEPALQQMEGMLTAYNQNDAKAFNQHVREYQALLEKDRPSQLSSKNTFTGRFIKRTFGGFYQFEAYFNHVAPFYHCATLYVVAFVLAVSAWLGWSGPFNRSAFLLLVVIFTVHSLALVARMYISGRPPVTNLYSSAVFIGWGIAALAGVYELMYRNGIGNVMAAILGFASLVIAHNLAGDGDTFIVLQAVLDTQFWLAVHVVTVTLGYATTFLAGAIGLLYILRGLLTPTLTPAVGKEFSRMIYGTVCFAIFFSFVGTVLGGLWADDSWGRFWGWDPKENGALIIVLWNALVLHARWGGMVKNRGLAVLAVAGNIVTTWSWFGVNELGVGLHSYGFTEGVLRTLGIFALTQLLIIGLGMLPKSLWWSFRVQADDKTNGKPTPATVS